jgi:large subunit ribosomal protein L10
MPSLKKVEVVNRIKEKLENSKVVIMTDYRGLDVNKIQDLKNKLNETKADYQVTKNTLLERALHDLKVEGLPEEALKGPTAVLFAYGDEAAPVKVLANFVKSTDLLKIKAGLLGKEVLSSDKINVLAKLPNRDVLLQQVVGGISSPIFGLINALQWNLSKLVFTLNAIKQSKS